MNNLSQKLDGGAIKVKKKKIYKKSPLHDSYKNFKKNKKDSQNRKTNIDLTPEGIKINVIKKETPQKNPKEIPKKESPQKESPKKGTPKKESPQKESSQKESPKKGTPQKESPQKESPKKRIPPKRTPKKGTPKKKKKSPNINIKKSKINQSKKHKFTKKSRVNKGGSKKKKKKQSKGRKTPFKCYSNNNKNINYVIEKVNKMDNHSMKQELLKNGIEIKGDRSKLIRDILIFSEMGGIKIHKE
ncbi:MAG: hypothetical protein CL470_08450 [Acidimicrobiaceae bacterium]|nr:hypothetical protein [Acidimicrobiaceae bacterium]